VFVPVADVSRYDLLIDTGERILRVEVKTTAAMSGEVDLRTRGGNQSWHGSSVFLSAQHCDVVFAVNLTTGVEQEYLIQELEGRSSVTLRAV
jgi:PD-(D/E)XK endonuclease